MWVTNDIKRFGSEKAAIDKLAADSDWLELGQWSIKDGYLVLECRIRSTEDWIPVTLQYSKNFPQTPPSVIPAATKLLSLHQYGAGGELCLQYRPDNWMPHYTGAQMLESAHALFINEKTTIEGEITAVAPADHNLTHGQSIRFRKDRLILTEQMLDWLDDAAEIHEARFSDIWPGMGARVVVAGIRRADGEVHWDETIPRIFRQGNLPLNGLVVTADAAPEIFPDERAALLYLLLGEALASEYIGKSETFYVLANYRSAIHAWIFRTNEIVELAVVMPNSTQQRLPSTHAVLSEKTIAVVGAGSIGSKVAASLTRCGARKFIVVDDDLFEEGNLVRSELDWSAVGTHKVDALRMRLTRLHPGIDLTTSYCRLGGQVSTDQTDAIMSLIANCDLIVDASADGRAFNFTAAAAVSGRKPMVWAEAYGGGYGGMISRARPGKEPNPYMMRELYTRWCEQLGHTAPQSTPGYGGATDGWIADDADVGVIAAHLTRFAIDILTRTESIFPYPLYLIGLREEWNFVAPFHTLPMELPSDVNTSWETSDPDFHDPENVKAFLELLQALGINEASNKPKTDA